MEMRSVMPKLKFGVFLPCHTFRTEKSWQLFNRLKDVVLECERLGYYSIWLDDHLMLRKMPIFECWTTLSALSLVTERIRLGTMVTCNSFRNPSLLAKMASTLDNISNGRLELGIGAGVQKTEHLAYGFLFLSPKARIERLAEAVEIVKKMWIEDKTSYKGNYYTIQNAVCEPKPLQRPHPPITIGGRGEKLTMRVTAKHADRYDWGYLPSLELERKLKLLEEHCEAVGRNFQEIEKSCWLAGQIFIEENRKKLEEKVVQRVPEDVTLEDFVQTSLIGTPEDCLKQVRQYTNLGITHFMLFFGDLPDLRGLRLFAKEVVKTTKSD
jgi:F420-dependent oxidoreductase-like protein